MKKPRLPNCQIIDALKRAKASLTGTSTLQVVDQFRMHGSWCAVEVVLQP